jgi:murein DD-endopeptidase MepM/ murein hydrolase activator NlpD
MGRAIRVFAAAAAACGVCAFGASPAFAATNGGLLATAPEAAIVWPAQGAITTSFSSWHDGIDIGTLRSLEVRAAAGGVVLEVGQPRGFEGYGNVILVDDGLGLKTLYAHLSSMNVHRGEHIGAGETLGVAGCTGICTGTHLHFEVWRRDRPVNPLGFLG